MNSDITYIYDITSPIIQYYNDTDYRKCIRTIFKMNEEKMKSQLNKLYDLSDMDPITIDEYMIDVPLMENAMKLLFNATSKHKLFCNLYDLAAAKMFSTNREIGQSILFSYDYVYLFHPCVCIFLTSPNQFNENLEYYNELVVTLQKK
jgi:hypothetical protein